MTEQEKKELIEIIDGLVYGEILIKKEAGKVVAIKKTESIKLSLDCSFTKKDFDFAFKVYEDALPNSKLSKLHISSLKTK